MGNFAAIHEVDDDRWDRVFRINVTALMRLTRAVYTASKHAVVGLTKYSVVMYGPKGLRFNAVAPGPTITNIVANWGSQLAAERLGPLMQATVPTPATAAQLAASITFLLSDDGTNVNGAPSSRPTAAGRHCRGGRRRGAGLNARGRRRDVPPSSSCFTITPVDRAFRGSARRGHRG